MECQACGYENPNASRTCLECGAGLQWTARKKAEGRFRDALDTARADAEARLQRAFRRTPEDRS